MPLIPLDGRRYPSVSTEIFGKRDASGSEVTLIIVRDGAVQMMEHSLLTEYAREVLMDDRMALADYAEQILAPHPMTGLYETVTAALDHNGNTSRLVLGSAQGGRWYEWTI